MDNIITIKKLSFSYDNKVIFSDFNLNIEKGKFIHVVGPNGSGKSTLVRILVGLLKSSGNINIYHMNLCDDNILDIRKNIGVVFENPDDAFVTETVCDEIVFSLENLRYSRKQMQKKLDSILDLIPVSHLLDKNPRYLSGGEKQLVSLACALILDPKILILDEAFTMVDGIEKRKLLKLLKKICNDKKTTIINITHDMEETTYGDKIVVLNKGKIVFNDSKLEVYKNEKELKRIGLELPFMVDLSNRLSYYGLVDKVILDMNAMVRHLWK